MLLAGTLLSAGAGAYFTDSYISDELTSAQERLEREYKPERVVVPKRDLRAGEVLLYENLAVRPVPRGFLHQDAVYPEAVDSIVGHRLVRPIAKGTPVLYGHVAEARGAGFSTLVAAGKRALTFPVDQVSSMAGLLRPGDRVDLLATVRIDGGSHTVPLLENVTVLATGQSVDDLGEPERRERYQTITLLVDPESASRITQAREIGTVTVVLRGAEDNHLAYAGSPSFDDLLGGGRGGGRASRVEIIRGGVN